MSSPRLSEILKHLKNYPEMGNFIARNDDVGHLNSLITDLGALDANAEPLAIYNYLWKLLNQFENASARVYSVKSLENMNNPARYISYALLMAIFNYIIESKNYAKPEVSSLGLYPDAAQEEEKGQEFLNALDMPWINETWNTLASHIVDHFQRENSNIPVKQQLADIAARYEDKEDFDQAKIVLSQSTVQLAISDLTTLVKYLQSAGLIQSTDVTIINSILFTLSPLCSGKTALDTTGQFHVTKLLDRFSDLRLQFSNTQAQEGFTAPAMAVPAMYIVEAVKEMLAEKNQNITSFKPTAEDWRQYALTMSFGDSFKHLAKRYPDASIFPVNDEEEKKADEDNELDEADLGVCIIPVSYPSEHEALVAIKNNRTRLYNGPTLKELLALVWFAILDLPQDQQATAKEELSTALQEIGHEGAELDPIEVMLSLCSIIDGVDPDVNLRMEGVSDVESLVAPYITTLINSVVQNEQRALLDPKDVDANLIQLRNKADHELVNKFGFVWALHADRIEILDKLITVHVIIASQNRLNVARMPNKNVDLYNVTNLEDLVGPSVKDFLKKKLHKNRKEKAVVLYDFYNNPVGAIKRLQELVDKKYTQQLGLVWTWHPEREKTLNNLISVEALIATQNTLNAGKDKHLAVSSYASLEDMLEVLASELLDTELKKLQNPEVLGQNEALDDEARESKYDEPVAQESNVVSPSFIEAADELFTQKFKLVWALRTDKAEMMARLFSDEAVKKAVERQGQPSQEESELMKDIEGFITLYIPVFLKNQLRGMPKPNDIAVLWATLIEEADKTFKVEFEKKKYIWPNGAKKVLEKLITQEAILMAQNEINKEKDKALDMNVAADYKTLFAPYVASILETELKADPAYLVLEDEKGNPNHHALAEEKSDPSPFALKYQQLREKAHAALFEKFGIVCELSQEACDAIEELTSDAEILAAQNRLNKQKDANLDIAKIGSVVAFFEQYVASLVEAKIKSCYVYKDNLEIDNAVLDQIVSAPLSAFMDIAVADKMMTEKFGILWLSDGKRREALNRVLTADEIAAAKNRVLECVLQPIVQKLLQKNFYNEFYNKQQVLEDKSNIDEEIPFLVRILPKVKEMADQYLADLFREFWTNNAAHDSLLNNLVSKEALSVARDITSDKRREQIKALRTREPGSANELSEWMPILLDQMKDKVKLNESLLRAKDKEIREIEEQAKPLDEKKDEVLDNDNEEEVQRQAWDKQRDQLQGELQIIAANYARSNACVTTLLAIQEKLNENADNAQQVALLKASYLRIVALDSKDKQIAEKAFVGTPYFKQSCRASIHRAYQSLLQEVRGEAAPESSSDLLQQLDTVMKETARFQSEKFLPRSYVRSYAGLVKDKYKDKDPLSRQLEQAIDIFKDYAGDDKGFFGGLYRICHFNRHHIDVARAIVNELTAMLKAWEANPAAFGEPGKVVQDAKDIVMDQVTDLIKNGTLKLDFLNSSFARRTSFVLNDLLSEKKLKVLKRIPEPEIKKLEIKKLEIKKLEIKKLEIKIPEIKIPEIKVEPFVLPAVRISQSAFTLHPPAAQVVAQPVYAKSAREIAEAEKLMAARSGLGI
ncbi:MAG: hypothetical protein P4M14_02900 [Gammaproteobacteria bacterium]|nr:hypothetical protein [Gammaproteobacteria bacterium]